MITEYLPPPWAVWAVWAVAALCALIATWMVSRTLLRSARSMWKARRASTTGKTKPTGSPATVEDRLTWVVAGIATAVSAQGMWKFAGDVLGLDGPLRALLFAFIELAIVISALRAKRSMRENFKAGLDGIAVWGLACLTAVLAALDAHKFGEIVFRLAAPLVAAWLWERGMRLERHRLRGTSGIHWRLTPERLLVRVGLAESTDRTASEVDAHRRITRVALAAKRVHQLREANAPERKLRKAAARRDRALDRAVEHTGLAKDERMQWALLDMVTTLGGAESLSEVLGTAKAPWAQLDHPAVTGALKHREAVELAAATREWTEAIRGQKDPEVSAAITSMAAYIAGPPVFSAPPAVTSNVTTNPVTERVTANVTNPTRKEVVFGPPWRPVVTPAVTPPVTSPVTTNPVTPGPKPEPDDQSKTQLMRELWDKERAAKRYPTVQELADHAGAHHTLASRLRKVWVTELPWNEQRKADPKKVTA